MARVPDAELARLKAEVSVARLVEGVGVELRRQGNDLVGRCPFHEDKTPSLVVSPGKNLWHCLGACATGGGPVDWVMTAQGVSFRHAVELLVAESPVLGTLAAVSPLSSGGPVKRSLARKLEPIAAPDAADVELLGRVVAHYAAALAGAGEVQEYLHRRRIAHPEAVEAFRLGFADRTLGYRLPNAQTRDGEALRSRLRALGVLRASGHEHFRGCLTVPVLDVEGRVGEVYGRRVQRPDPRRAATSAHLYLPGPHRGVWNIGAFAATDELVICESLIDALTLWCAGFRHVTAAYGAEGWTAEHQAAVEAHGIGRVLIAYDRDPAGDTGAKTLAGQLTAVGVECFRVELPHGVDVNEVAVQARNPTDVLGGYLRKAAWMGTGKAPKSSMVVAVEPPASLAAESLGDGEISLTGQDDPEPGGPAEPAAEVPPEDVSPVPRPSSLQPVERSSQRELVLTVGQRRWRVRGLEKVTSFDLLRVNLLVGLADGPADGTAGGADHRFHVDTLDLYSARARAVFVAAAVSELGVEAEVVKADLGRVLLAAEARAEEVITAALEPTRPEVVVTPQGRAAALALLKDPDLIGRIEQDFAAVGMVGEGTNCLVGYLAAISRKLPAPLAVIVQSTSAAGKSAVMEAVLGFVPPEDRVSFSAMTGQSLFYLGESDLAHKVLSIAEEEGASRASYALKLLQSEGELSIASTGKDTASGRLVTHTYTVTGPTAIVLTTTAIDVDEELLNRCLVLTVDEDRDQTRAIHQAQRRAQTLAGLAARAERERVVNLHRDAQRLLEPLAVVNPFADRLTFADARTRTRRDHGKYLGLIAAVTLLHQHQRARKTTTLAGRQVTYVESTLADIEVANRLAHAVLGQSLDELPPQTRRLLTMVHAHVVAEAERLDVPVELVRFTRRQLRESLGFGDTQLKVHLARLVDLELLVVHRFESGGFGYELTWRGEGEQGAPFMVGLTQPDQLTAAHGYPADRSRSQAARSGSGRGPVGAQSPPAVGQITPLGEGESAATGLGAAQRAVPVNGHVNGVVVAGGR
jgi:DNA primase catalytic core